MSRLFIILGAILFCTVLNAKELKNVKIDKQAFAYLYFDSIPEYGTSLSADKTKIFLNIPGGSYKGVAPQAHASGRITTLYTKLSRDTLIITLELKEKSGYNAIPQPFSQSIRVDVFSWDGLKRAEDKYRTAMLAYEENLLDVTVEGLKDAAKDSVINAVSYLGLIFLKEGKVNSAIRFLTNAANHKSDVFDIYGALWQAHQIKGDTVESEKYLALFKELSGIDVVTKMRIDTLRERGDQLTEDTSYLIEAKDIVSESDSLINKKFENIFAKSDSAISNQQEDSAFPWWFQYLLWGIFAGLLLLIFVYFKWRMKQVKILKNKKAGKKKFKEELKDQEESFRADNSALLNKYKQNEKQQNIAEDEELEKVSTAVTKEETEAINKALDAIKEKKKQQQDKKAKDVKNNTSLQLAGQLAEEQKQIKSVGIKSVSDAVNKTDPEKLNKIARKLGIEKGIEQSENKYDQIKSDKKTIDKLAKKFGKER